MGIWTYVKSFSVLSPSLVILLVFIFMIMTLDCHPYLPRIVIDDVENIPQLKCYLRGRFTLINIDVQKMHCMLSISVWNHRWFCFLLSSLYDIAWLIKSCIFDVIWYFLSSSATSGLEKISFPAMISRCLFRFHVIFFSINIIIIKIDILYTMNISNYIHTTIIYKSLEELNQILQHNTWKN